MKKHLLLTGLLTSALALSACGPMGMTPGQLSAAPVPVAAVTDAQTALLAYQAALGVAQVAVRSNPALLLHLNALTAKAQPYVDSVQAHVTDAAAAPSLGALAAELLVEMASAIKVVPAAS